MCNAAWRIMSVTNAVRIRPRTATLSRTPVITVAMVVLRLSIVVVHIPGVIDVNAGATIVVAVIMVAVIRVAEITRVINMQIVV